MSWSLRHLSFHQLVVQLERVKSLDFVKKKKKMKEREEDGILRREMELVL